MTGASYKDPKQPLEIRVQSLLDALTLEEKLSLCAGQNFWETREIPRLGLNAFRMTDGPRGVAFHSSRRKRCTAFPSGIAQAASWDERLLRRFGEALAEETLSVGARTILGPAINITRTPLNGRTFEYFSEDPVLNARLTVPVVEGVQSRRVAACVKHYAANNQETHRMRNSSEVSERALEEIYLPAFRAAVEQADAWSVMAAYNAVNGVAACENGALLKDRLRDEYGFRGFIVSDWFAVRRTSSPEACIRAGLTLEMPGKGSRYRYKNLKAAYDRGLFSEAELDNNLKGLLRVMVLTGHLDPEPPTGRRNTAEHQSLAREMAEAAMTLLKNEGTLLPLDPARVRKVAALGPRLKRRHCWPLWGGSAGVWPPYEVTPWRGLQEENRGRFQWSGSPAEADVVLLFVGVGHKPGFDSEAMDHKYLGLPPKQEQLIRETVAANPKTVIVLTNGGPLSMPWLDQVPAVLESWYPGMEGGRAIARTLFGECNPSGKLPVTFPRTLADSPAHKSRRTYPGDEKTVHYEEELLVGYRHFDRRGIEPLFPFGHGLSYTRFEYSELQVSADRLSSVDVLALSLTVTNGGDRGGSRGGPAVHPRSPGGRTAAAPEPPDFQQGLPAARRICEGAAVPGNGRPGGILPRNAPVATPAGTIHRAPWKLLPRHSPRARFRIRMRREVGRCRVTLAVHLIREPGHSRRLEGKS
jgi:beta-glucosidase